MDSFYSPTQTPLHVSDVHSTSPPPTHKARMNSLGTEEGVPLQLRPRPRCSGGAPTMEKAGREQREFITPEPPHRGRDSGGLGSAPMLLPQSLNTKQGE